MQVKKFEARTMKEALQMMKTQLGPDAIILSARDHRKSFGLVGEVSVEITAAVSEETLHRKKFVESRIREEERQRLAAASAKSQKQFMDKMVNKYTEEKQPQKPISNVRYIDIADDVEAAPLQTAAQERIRNAAQRALNALGAEAGAGGSGNTYDRSGYQTPQRTPQQAPPQAPQQQPNSRNAPERVRVATQAQTNQNTQDEISSLKGEIESLKKVLTDFQTVPQNVYGRHPGSEYGLSADVAPVYEKLTEAGLHPEIATQILQLAQEQMQPARLKNKALVDAWAAQYILTSTNVVPEKKQAQWQIFVGPSGTGKTASLVKLASHFIIKDRKKVAIATTDTLKVGAADQLRIYAQILNVPFVVIRDASEWAYVQTQLGDYDHILVDSPGMSLKTVKEISWLKGILPKAENSAIHLVLTSLAKDSDLTEIGKRFKAIEFNDAIFSNLDESVQHGVIYNFMRRFETPLHSFGLGSRVPEDFEMATKERVLDLIFKLTKIRS